MMKPQTIDGYSSEISVSVKQTCLYVATKLGDHLDNLVVVGGLVPTLIIDQENLPESVQPHVGTMDVDLGMTLAILDDGFYRKLTESLRGAGFEPDVNADGNKTFQRWRDSSSTGVTVDFLMPPNETNDRPGKLRHIENDFAAVITPGLELAFRDSMPIQLSGLTSKGEEATREIQVCGPGAFIILKSLAFGVRGENKDAYDLFYVLRNFGSGVRDVATHLLTLLDDEQAIKALGILENDFTNPQGLGPMRAAAFLGDQKDANLRADVVGFVRQLLEYCR